MMRVGGSEILVGVDDANWCRIQRTLQARESRPGGAPEPSRRCRWRLGLSERAERIFDSSLTELCGSAPRPLGRVRRLTVNLLVEDPVPAAHDGLRVAVHVPRHAETRREIIEIAVREP